MLFDSDEVQNRVELASSNLLSGKKYMSVQYGFCLFVMNSVYEILRIWEAGGFTHISLGVLCIRCVLQFVQNHGNADISQLWVQKLFS